MSDYIQWPSNVLPPAEVIANITPFTRGGGRSLGGLERNVRSDRGFWQITLDQVPVWTPAQHRTWNAIRVALGGKVGLIAVPVWSFKSAPYVTGGYEASPLSTHDDESTFSDGSHYVQGSIAIETAAASALGSTQVTIRLISAASPSGVRFSFQNALYETGPIISTVGENTYRVSVFPALRTAIPSGAKLELNEPLCICRLKDDNGMDISEGITPLLRKSVSFVEAVDYWNDLALGIS